MPKPEAPKKTPEAAGLNNVDPQAVTNAVTEALQKDRKRRAEINAALPGEAYATIRNQADADNLTVDQAKALAFDVAVENHTKELGEVQAKYDDANDRLKAIGKGDDDATAPTASDNEDLKSEADDADDDDDPKAEDTYAGCIASLVKDGLHKAQARMQAAEKYPDAHNAWVKKQQPKA